MSGRPARHVLAVNDRQRIQVTVAATAEGEVILDCLDMGNQRSAGVVCSNLNIDQAKGLRRILRKAITEAEDARAALLPSATDSEEQR